MNTQERELVRFLRLLDGLGCLQHVILIGSWAELLYERAGLLEGFEPSIKTMDIDFPFLDTGVLCEVIAGLTRKERSRTTSFLEAHGLRIS